MTIVFITIYPFNEDYALKYGFDIFKRKGFNVVILNVLSLMFSKEVIKQAGHGNLDKVSGVNQIRVKSEMDCVAHLNRIKGEKIAQLVLSPNIKLLRCLNKANVDYIESHLKLNPTRPTGETAFTKRFLRAIRLLTNNPIDLLSKLWDLLCFNIPYSLLRIRHPKYVLLGSHGTNRRCRLSRTKPIYIHSFDYDRYLQNLNQPKNSTIPDYDYYVFLLCTPWAVHDYILLNYKAAIGKMEYADGINRFFDFVEQKTGKKIIISAHPKASEDENVYGGRPFILFNTEQLVKYSTGVICHYSGAINFAVIYNKPLCFISMRKLNNDSYFKRYINAYAGELGSKINYIDEDEDLNKLIYEGMFSYNKDKYEDYKDKYLRYTESDDVPCWETVANVLTQEYLPEGS